MEMKGDGVIIRKALHGDVDTLLSMLSGLFSIEDDFVIDPRKQRAGLELIISGKTGGVIFMAESDSVPVGMVNLQRIVSTAAGGYSVLLEDLYVVPGMRDMGIGTMLVNEAVKWGEKEKALRVQLGADSRNLRALSFYYENGFVMSNLVFHYKPI